MKDLEFSKKTYIMGVINVTPDSFYDGGKYLTVNAAVRHAEDLYKNGADILDIGGQSTRPGARQVPEAEEAARVFPVLRKIIKRIPCAVSIDTFYHSIADRALDMGARMINDITALNGDTEMARVIARHDAWIVLMHMKGTPRTMQKRPVYKNVVSEITDYLKNAVKKAVKAGISPEKIIIDPGIGFGKTAAHNIEILKNLKVLKALKKPLLVGLSNKAFIGHITGRGVSDRAFGTAAACALAAAGGADILRIHDVAGMSDAVKIADAVYPEKGIGK